MVTPQMSMKRGTMNFGEDGVKAVTDEVQQLHDRVVMKAKHKKDLTPEQRLDALAYLMFLKRKRSGKVKGGQSKTAGMDQQGGSDFTHSCYGGCVSDSRY